MSVRTWVRDHVMPRLYTVAVWSPPTNDGRSDGSNGWVVDQLPPKYMGKMPMTPGAEWTLTYTAYVDDERRVLSAPVTVGPWLLKVVPRWQSNPDPS